MLLQPVGSPYDYDSDSKSPSHCGDDSHTEDCGFVAVTYPLGVNGVKLNAEVADLKRKSEYEFVIVTFTPGHRWAFAQSDSTCDDVAEAVQDLVQSASEFERVSNE